MLKHEETTTPSTRAARTTVHPADKLVSPPANRAAWLADRHPVLFTLAFVCTYVLAAEVGHLLSFQGAFATVWPPSGVYLGAFLLLPRRNWRWVMLGAGLGNLLSDIALHGQTLTTSLAFWCINTSEAWIASHLMLRLGMHTVNFDSPGNVVRLALVASGVAMLHSAVWGATAATLLLGAPDWFTAWVLWWSSCLIGVLLVVPLLTAFANRPLSRWNQLPVKGKVEAVAVLVCVAATSWVALHNADRPMDFLPFPALLWASTRFGSTGAAISVAVAILVSISRLHILSGVAPDAVHAEAIELQLYACTMSLSFLALGAVMASHQRVHEESQALEERFRDLLDHIGDLVFLIRLDSHVEYANPAGLLLFGSDDGSRPALMLLRDRLVAEDRAGFDRTMRDIVAGKPQAQIRLRMADSLGRQHVFQARLTPRRVSGNIQQVRVVLQDVTAREERDQLLEVRRLELERERSELSEQAHTDSLTGLNNRRTFDTRLPESLEVAHRNAEPVSLVLIDIDHFKDFNDEYGHQTGDMVLRAFGDLLRQATSQTGGSPARYGGEEFAVILPGMMLEDATQIAEHIRAQVANQRITAFAVTISAGVASTDPTRQQPEGALELIQRADMALYRAKQQGRNRVEFDESQLRDRGPAAPLPDTIGQVA
jgi:diguanylate cyclase (GGDEF)-like protein